MTACHKAELEMSDCNAQLTQFALFFICMLYIVIN